MTKHEIEWDDKHSPSGVRTGRGIEGDRLVIAFDMDAKLVPLVLGVILADLENGFVGVLAADPTADKEERARALDVVPSRALLEAVTNLTEAAAMGLGMSVTPLTGGRGDDADDEPDDTVAPV